ncbi:hypothetical protein VPH234P6_0205 [Vibrio phage 234P6]
MVRSRTPHRSAKQSLYSHSISKSPQAVIYQI